MNDSKYTKDFATETQKTQKFLCLNNASNSTAS